MPGIHGHFVIAATPSQTIREASELSGRGWLFGPVSGENAGPEGSGIGTSDSTADRPVWFVSLLVSVAVFIAFGS